MLDTEQKRLVESYVAARTWVSGGDGALRRQDESDWAESALYDAVWEQPALGWAMIREVARCTQNGAILEELANGPLHQLLVEHPAIMDDIEVQAKSAATVGALLSHFWEGNALPEGLKRRIVLASGSGP